ncbi:MAG: hypothetical protein BGO49_13120 [Planctomycetales bacterium 71-10]|nr:MAG: hypothetical protein BGO49_13120 [Planctomycetales bacterium 71-10]
MVLAPYELTNDGDVPIRIIKVESSCNCSAPKVEPWTVEPGGKAIVYTETKRPPLGERVVSFTIHTDSQVSPTLNLHLKVASDRKPPYLSGVRGDANFQGSPGVGDRSEIVVYTLSEREVDREPKVLVHPAGLGLACTLIGSNASRADGLQIWQHEYQYKLEFDKAPPPGISTGEIVVEDPWDPKHLERLPVYINNKNGLQLFPSTVSLARADPHDDSCEAKIVVKGGAVDSIAATSAGGRSSDALILEKSQGAEDSGVSFITVRLRAGREILDGEHRIRVKGASGEEVEAVVMIRTEAKP